MLAEYKYRSFVKIIFTIGLVFFSFIGICQTDTEFWFSAPEVNRYHSGGNAEWPTAGYGNVGTPCYLRFSSFDKAASVTISMPANAANFNGGVPITFTMAAYSTQTIDLSSYIGDNVAGITPLKSIENRLKWTTSLLTGATPYINKNNKGILIQSDNNIAVYYDIAVQFNMDLIPLKGKNALGTKFYVPFQTTNDTRSYPYSYRPYSSIDIVATEDNTKINIIAPYAIWARGIGSVSGTQSIWLNAGETAIITPYEKHTGFDYQTTFSKSLRLAGSYVEVDQTQGSGAPITVISHDDLVQSNYTLNPDYVIDQIVPIELIGTDYAVIQGIGCYDATHPCNETEDWIYIVGTQASTSVTVKTGPTSTTTTYSLNAGNSQAFSMNNTGYKVVSVKSNKPVYVYHMSGAGRQKAGAIIPTISNCTGSGRVAFTRGHAGSYKFYLNILVWNTAIGKFKLQKNNVDVTGAELAVLNAINNAANYSTLPETGTPYSNWRWARIDASALFANVAYILLNDENVFHLGVINGETDNDAFYGYFSNYNQFKVDGTVGPSVSPEIKLCYGASTQLYAEGGTKFKWSPIDFLDDPNIYNPKVVFPTVSTKYKVVAYGACNLKDSAYVKVNVSAPLTPSFIADTLYGCGSLPVNFTNTSTGNPTKLYWYWKVKGAPNPGTLFKTSNLAAVPLPADAHLASHTFTNATASPVTYVVNLLVESTSCSAVDSVSIVVYPSVSVAPTVSVNNGCNPLEVQFFAHPTGNTGTAAIDWDFGDGGSSSLTNPYHTYYNFNSTSASHYSKVRLVDQWNVCSDEDSVQVTIQPFIKASFTINKVEGCSPLSVAIVNDSRGGINQWYWDRNGDGTEDYTGEGSGTIVYTNPTTTNTPLSIPIKLRVTNAGGCSDAITRTIKVNPQAVINTFTTDNHGNSLGCSPLNHTYTATTTNATIYHWLLDGNAIDNTLTTSYTFNNYGASSTTKTVSFTADNQYGCAVTQTSNITVQPFVDAQFVADNEVGCSPLSVNFTNASSLGSSLFQWYIDGTLFASTTNIPSQSFTNPTVTNAVRTVPIRLVARNTAGCTDDITKNITVNPQSTASFTYTDNGNTNHCSQLVAGFTSSVTNTETYQWEFGSYGASSSANPTFTFTNDGTTDVIVPVTLSTNNSFGCPATFPQNITVRPSVKALFSLDKTAGCPPYNANVSATTSAAIINYTWDFDGTAYTGSTQVFSNPSNLTGVDITRNIKLTVSSGFCSDQTTKSIVVYPQVEAKYTALPLLTGCSPITVNFVNQSALYGTGTAVNNIVWDFNDNTSSTATSISHTFTNTDNTTPKIFNVSLTATTNKGCTDSKTFTVTANPTVNAAFNTQIDKVCTPVQVHITNASFAGPTISTYNWNFDGGTPLGTVDDDFVVELTNTDPENPIIKTISLNLSNTYGCTSSTSQTFTIDPMVVAGIKINAPLTGGGVPIDRLCAPATFTFGNLCTGGSLSYGWDFNDGETHTVYNRNAVTHKFENRTATTKTFNVKLTATNTKGCTANATQTVYAFPEVDSKFSMTRDSSCTPFYIKLKDESLNGTQWQWDFGHTIGGVPQQYTSTTSGENFNRLIDNESPNTIKTYKINLRLNDLTTGCWDTISQFLEVYPRVVSNFAITPTSGCSPTTITFANSSTGLGSYLWELDNGLSFNTSIPVPISIDNSSTVNEKIINIKLTATNTLGCKSVTSKTVTIAPKVIASFTSSMLESCYQFTPTFTNLTPSTAYNYSWSVNGTAEATTQDHSRTFTNASNPPVIDKYKVLLRSSYKNNAACFDTISRTITVYPRIYPNFLFSKTTDCQPLITNITNTTVSYSSTATYNWNLGNGVYSTLTNLSNVQYKNNSATKDSTYNIKLIATSVHQCVDSITKTVTVHPKPIASYIMNNESLGCSPFAIELHNHSVGINLNYSFDLSDGPIINTADINQVITHTYHNLTNDVQPYNITLTATTAFGCQNTTSQTIYSYPEVTAQFSFAPVNAACSPYIVGFNNATTNGYFYQWSFNDGTNSNLFSPSHRFVNTTENDKVFNVQLISISQYDCSDTTVLPFTVWATPVANFSVDPPLKVFPDATFNFHNQSSPAANTWSYYWTFGDGYTSTNKEAGDHTYTTWGPKSNNFIYKSTLRVDAPHCWDSTSNILRLLPAEPIPFFTADIYKACSPLEAHFINASQYGSSYVWDFDDGTTSTEDEPIHIFTEPRYYNVKLRVNGDGGETFYFKTFRVFQNPIADFAVYPNHVMLPDAEVHIYNLTKYGDRYEWDLGDGNLTTDINPVHKYTEIGNFRISLRAYAADSLGACQDTTSKFPAVWVLGIGKVEFPNAFMPSKTGSNGGKYDELDYKNEVFHPMHYGIVEYKMMVFNRWGEQIFESNDVNIGWDGYFKGKLCDQGVYIWRAIGKFTNGHTFDKKGNVTLLR